MNYHFESKYAKCPFYQSEYPRACRVICEGIKDTKTLSVAFKGTRQFKNYKDGKCYADYTECEIYKMLMRGYENGR